MDKGELRDVEAQEPQPLSPQSPEKAVSSDNTDTQPHRDTEAQMDKGELRDLEAQEPQPLSPQSPEKAVSSDNTDAQPHRDTEAQYDSGWSWVVCGTTVLMEFFVGGMITSSGVVYSALLDEFNKSRTETAWVSSLAVSTYYLFFPLGAILSERYGCWVVALIGCLTCSVGLLSSSFVATFPVLYLTYSLIWGLGASLVYFADLLILTKYFKARLALANGITALGGAIGGSVLNPTLQQLFIHIGFANTFRVLSSAFFVLSVFALLFRPRCRADVQSSKRRQEIFDWTIVRNTRYLVWVGVVFILMLGYMAPFVHLVRLAEDIGIDKTRASLLLTLVTAGSGLGRVLFGRISDIRRFNRIYIAQIAFLGIGVSNLVIPLSQSYAVLAVAAVAFGLFGGGYLILNPVIICDIVGQQKVSYGLGLTFFVIAIPRTLGPLIAGGIYDNLQSYAVAFYVLGATSCLASLLVSLINILSRKSAKVTQNQVTPLDSFSA